MMNGRKIAFSYENPFDIKFISVAEKINTNIFRPLNFTPNMITTLSLLCGLFSCYSLYNKNFKMFCILFALSYLFDCADGNYARKYDMVTSFGDFFDHISDTVKIVLFLLIIYNFKEILTNRERTLIITSVIILIILSLIHIGCQEKIYNNKDVSTLSFTKNLCVNGENINVTRFFGSGTLILYIIFIGIWLDIKKFR